MRSERGEQAAPCAEASRRLPGLLFLHAAACADLPLCLHHRGEELSVSAARADTLKWFAVVWDRQDIWNALWLSVKVAADRDR